MILNQEVTGVGREDERVLTVKARRYGKALILWNSITLETKQDQMDLKSLPHATVQNLEEQALIEDSGRR